MFVYDLQDHKLWNRARWQEPAFHKASDLTKIHRWSSPVWKRPSIEPNEILTRWWSNMYRYETAFCHKKKISWWPGIGSWIASFRIPIISTTREGLFAKKYWLVFIVYWATFCQSTQDKSSNDIKCIIRLWAETGYSSLITQKSHMISWSFFRTRLVKLGLMSCPDDLYTYISLNSALLIFYVIIICGKSISTSYYNAWCHW